jgi:hypothetical protein
MKIAIFFISGFLLLSFNNDNRKKDSISKSLIGKWVHEQDDNNESFRFVKSIELKEKAQGFIFRESGEVTIYEEFGCQMPPSFRYTNAKWEVRSNGTVLIKESVVRTRRMKIIEIESKFMRFKWRKDKLVKRKKEM